MRFNAEKLARMGVLSAMAVIFVFARFPIFPAAAFLEFEIGDTPILIGTFLYGPVAGIIMTVVVSFVQAFTVSQGSGLIGAVMHIIATGAFAAVAGSIYKKMHSLKGAFLALFAGSIVMTAVMVGLNVVVTPRFMNVPVEVVKGMLIPYIIPFNLIKSFGNSIVVLLVYKPVANFLRKTGSKKTAI
jgi:riboflavin transporter FmnP